MPSPDPAAMRRGYDADGELPFADAADWPTLLADWFAAAVATGAVGEANAMQLATVDADGRPGVRTVLAKAIDARGVAFYTNLDSAKGRALAARPFAEAVFAWLPLQRQVRLRGPVEPVGEDEARQYWDTRPRGSQLGAWASRQSRPIASRNELLADYAAIERRFAGSPVPLPPFWGGLRLVPDAVEFWSGRPDRLHDRLLFALEAGSWVRRRLAP